MLRHVTGKAHDMERVGESHLQYRGMNNVKEALVNCWAIDSLKIRIPLNRVQILDEGIREMVVRVSARTGEVLEEKQNTKESRDEHGIKTVYSIEKRATKFDTIEYLVVLVNAKQLKERYFEGIKGQNVAQLHSYLIGLGVVHFSLKEFLRAECTDIDFRKDFTAKEDTMKEGIRFMLSNSKPHTEFDKGALKFWRKDNKGLQWNKRNTTKVRTAPFLKIYSKTLDFKTKSNVFALSHFESIPEDLWRFEFTIKNKDHLDSFKLGNTLSELISIPVEQIETMSIKSLKAVLNQNQRELKQTEGIPPKDVYEVNGLVMLLDSGHQWHIIKERMLTSLTGSNRSKKLKRMQELFEDYIRPMESYEKQAGVDDILNQIGYTF